jgi:hypothetical protein
VKKILRSLGLFEACDYRDGERPPVASDWGLRAIIDNACGSFGCGAGWKSVHPCDTFK